MRFPKVRGSNLERRAFTLPYDLEGDINLVILAFWRHHQMLVDTWIPLTRRLQLKHPGLKTYELPVIESRSKLSQWFIDSGMRAGIPDLATRNQTVTLYVDKAAFLDPLGIDDDTTIHSLLIDRRGNVLWCASGPLDSDKEQALENFLAPCPSAA